MEGTAEKTNMAVPETADTVAEADAGNVGHCSGSLLLMADTVVEADY